LGFGIWCRLGISACQQWRELQLPSSTPCCRILPILLINSTAVFIRVAYNLRHLLPQFDSYNICCKMSSCNYPC
jgi:hypothetical protein